MYKYEDLSNYLVVENAISDLWGGGGGYIYVELFGFFVYLFSI